MERKTQNIPIVFCMIMLFSIGSGAIAQDIPLAVTQTAEDELRYFLSKIPQNEPEKYGFTKNDDLDQAQVSRPFKLHTITRSALSAYEPGDPIDSILSETGLWYFPVMIRDESKCILVVDQMDNQWKAVSLGYAWLAGELNTLREQWSEKQGYNPLLVVVFQAKEYLFTVPEKDHYNLTPLIPARGHAESRSSHLKYSNLDKLSDTIDRMKK